MARLLQRHAESRDAVALERARQQLTLRALRALEQPKRRLEAAVQDVFTFGQPRDTAAWLERLHAVSVAQVQAVFAGLHGGQAAVALAGSVPARARERALALFVPGRATQDTEPAGQTPASARQR